MSRLFTLGYAFHLKQVPITQSRLFGSSPQHIAVVGGGLAGLSTTFHLLEKIDNVRITIIDKANPGEGGASSVAGG